MQTRHADLQKEYAVYAYTHVTAAKASDMFMPHEAGMATAGQSYERSAAERPADQENTAGADGGSAVADAQRAAVRGGAGEPVLWPAPGRLDEQDGNVAEGHIYILYIY